MTTPAIPKNLRDIGIDISIYAGDGRRLNEATQYAPMSVDNAITMAQTHSEVTAEAETVEVSVTVQNERKVLWNAAAWKGRWPWQNG